MASSRDSQPGSSIYTPLDKATREIRLLRFTEPPAGSADNLHFTLTVHKLPAGDEQTHEDDQRTKFIALSYAWGPEEPKRSIIVNGERLEIRENLHALLQVLRKPTHVSNTSSLKAAGSHVTFSGILRQCPYIWADAICINQKASEEKNQQVNMMGEIYLQAEWVVCWLGPAADHSKLAMDCLRDWGDERPWDPNIGPPANALDALLKRPYWQRLWIVQEFALARRPLLLCGRSMISLSGSRGGGIIHFMKEWCDGDDLPAGNVLSSNKISGNSVDDRELYDLHSLVWKFWDQECEKLHDRVFALLALYYRNNSTWDPEIPRVTADYNLTLEQLSYRVLADCSAQCVLGREYADFELMSALKLSFCKVESPDHARVFVQEVLGREGFRMLYQFTRHLSESLTKLQFTQKRYTSDQLTKHELIQRTIIRECSVAEVTGHLERLTGLTREDMLEDPEGVYLEVLGRLFHYKKHQPRKIGDIWEDARSARGIWTYNHDPPGIWGKYTSSWEVFINILRRTLGMPLIYYALRDIGPG